MSKNSNTARKNSSNGEMLPGYRGPATPFFSLALQQEAGLGNAEAVEKLLDEIDALKYIDVGHVDVKGLNVLSKRGVDVPAMLNNALQRAIEGGHDNTIEVLANYLDSHSSSDIEGHTRMAKETLQKRREAPLKISFF